ncbi:hypothetical protein GEMRC1_003700 [Eukaryota sp. GEM-RC1]
MNGSRSGEVPARSLGSGRRRHGRSNHSSKHRGGPRFYSSSWFGPSPVWYWSPASYNYCCYFVLVLIVLVVVGLIAGSYSNSDRVLSVVPKSTLLFDLDTSKVSEVRFKDKDYWNNFYTGKVYKCNGIPNYNNEFTGIKMNRPVLVPGKEFEYYQLNLNPQSYVEYAVFVSRPIDFYILRGQENMKKYTKGNSFFYIMSQAVLNMKEFSNRLTASHSDAYFWVLENKYSVFSSDGDVVFNFFLRTFDVSKCEIVCQLEKDPYCIVPITRGSDEKIILEGTQIEENKAHDITFEETKYPANWGQPLAIISVCLFAISICVCMVAAYIGKNRSSSSETQSLIQSAPQPTVVVNNNSIDQPSPTPSGMYQGEP